MLIPAAHADLREAVALINTSYRGKSSRQGWTHEADYIDGERTTLATLEADLSANPNARFLLWRDAPDGPLLGCVWLEPHDDGVWYLGLLTVRPDQQDRGLGRAMLSKSEEAVRQGGGSLVEMTVVHVRDTLIAWYRRCGYVLLSETRPFPYGDPPRGDVHFVVLRKTL